MRPILAGLASTVKATALRPRELAPSSVLLELFFLLGLAGLAALEADLFGDRAGIEDYVVREGNTAKSRCEDRSMGAEPRRTRVYG